MRSTSGSEIAGPSRYARIVLAFKELSFCWLFSGGSRCKVQKSTRTPHGHRCGGHNGRGTCTGPNTSISPLLAEVCPVILTRRTRVHALLVVHSHPTRVQSPGAIAIESHHRRNRHFSASSCMPDTRPLARRHRRIREDMPRSACVQLPGYIKCALSKARQQPSADRRRPTPSLHIHVHVHQAHLGQRSIAR